MKATTILSTIIVGAAVAVAQLDQIPQCALSCAISSIGTSGCSPTDISCVCNASSFISDITACVQNSCSAEQLAQTIEAAKGLCLQAGVTLTIPGSEPTPTTTPAAPTTTAAAPTTTSAAAETTSSAAAPSSSSAGAGYGIYVPSSKTTTTTAYYVSPTPKKTTTTTSSSCTTSKTSSASATPISVKTVYYTTVLTVCPASHSSTATPTYLPTLSTHVPHYNTSVPTYTSPSAPTYTGAAGNVVANAGVALAGAAIAMLFA